MGAPSRRCGAREGVGLCVVEVEEIRVACPVHGDGRGKGEWGDKEGRGGTSSSWETGSLRLRPGRRVRTFAETGRTS